MNEIDDYLNPSFLKPRLGVCALEKEKKEKMLLFESTGSNSAVRRLRDTTIRTITPWVSM